MAHKHGHVAPAQTQRFQVAHVTFELRDLGDSGQTFALIPGEAFDENKRRPLFTGHIERGMATELRKLAHAIDAIENKRTDHG